MCGCESAHTVSASASMRYGIRRAVHLGNVADLWWWPFVRIRRRGRQRTGIFGDEILEMFDAGLQLGITAPEGGGRQIIHRNVRLHAAAFDEPFALRTKHSDFRRRGDALILQLVFKAQPNLATPHSRADHFADAEALYALAEGLPVAGGEFTTETGPGGEDLWRMTYRKSKSASGVVIEPLVSANLVDWTALTATPTGAEDALSIEMSVSADTAAAPRRFMRLKVRRSE